MTGQRVLQATKNIWNWFCLHTYTRNRSPNLKAKTMKNRDGIFSQRPTMTYEHIYIHSPKHQVFTYFFLCTGGLPYALSISLLIS